MYIATLNFLIHCVIATSPRFVESDRIEHVQITLLEFQDQEPFDLETYVFDKMNIEMLRDHEKNKARGDTDNPAFVLTCQTDRDNPYQQEKQFAGIQRYSNQNDSKQRDLREAIQQRPTCNDQNRIAFYLSATPLAVTILQQRCSKDRQPVNIERILRRDIPIIATFSLWLKESVEKDDFLLMSLTYIQRERDLRGIDNEKALVFNRNGGIQDNFYPHTFEEDPITFLKNGARVTTKISEILDEFDFMSHKRRYNV